MREGKRYPRSILIAGIIFFAVASAIIWYKMSGKDHVTITQQAAQEILNKNLPLSRDFQRYLLSFNAKIDNVRIFFRDGNQIHIYAEGSVATSKGSAEIQINTVGVPEYRTEAFYFNPQRFELVKFELSEEAKTSINKAGRIARAGVKKYFGEILDEAGVEVRAERISQKIKEGAKNAAEEAIINHLSKHPVKKMESAKEIIVGLAIERMEVNNGDLTIYFSLLKLSWAIAQIIILAIAMLCLLITVPWWGPAILLIAPFDVK